MKKEKFEGNLNGKAFSDEKEFLKALQSALEDGKIKSISCKHSVVDDGVSENQLSLFEEESEDTTGKDRFPKDLFEIKVPVFEDLIDNPAKKANFYRLVDKLKLMYEDYVRQDASSENPKKIYEDLYNDANNYFTLLTKDYQHEFVENTKLKEKLKASKGKLDRLMELKTVVADYLNYYNHLALCYQNRKDIGKIKNKETKETKNEPKSVFGDIGVSFEDFSKLIEKMFE